MVEFLYSNLETKTKAFIFFLFFIFFINDRLDVKFEQGESNRCVMDVVIGVLLTYGLVDRIVEDHLVLLQIRRQAMFPVSKREEGKSY